MNYTGDAQNTITLLEDHFKTSDELKLAQCTFLFQQDRYAEAYQRFKHFTHSDRWYEKKKGWQFLLKKSILEILLLIELAKLDLLFYRLQAFKRKFNKFLKENGEDRVITFMSFLNAYSENPKVAITEAFKSKVEKSFNWIGPEREDIFVMSFYAWLKAKMEKKKLYQTTLKLVQNS